MIQIEAKLLRDQSAIFLCGEVLECFITFTNLTQPEQRTTFSNNDILENLAWASAQVNGYCKTQFGQEANNNNVQQTSLTRTSLNIQENTILSTDPKILFCDLRLAPGEARTYYYREQIPYSSPPTYRGIDIKYYYKISIATQKLGSQVQLLHVPIRILPLLIEDKDKPADQLVQCDATNEELTPTNPFLMDDRKTISRVEIALETLQNITARRRPNFYAISNRRGKVGRYCLFKPFYKLGEDIVGTFDFSSRTVRCVQLSVTLQCEEIILENRKIVENANVEQQTANHEKEKEISSNSNLNNTRITNYTKHHEVCLGLMQTQMILPIPLYVTPTFATDLVEVKWRLHFQFVTTTSNELFSVNEDSENWGAPKNIDIETMIWNLPITIYSTPPTQVYHPSSVYTLKLK